MRVVEVFAYVSSFLILVLGLFIPVWAADRLDDIIKGKKRKESEDEMILRDLW